MFKLGVTIILVLTFLDFLWFLQYVYLSPDRMLHQHYFPVFLVSLISAIVSSFFQWTTYTIRWRFISTQFVVWSIYCYCCKDYSNKKDRFGNAICSLFAFVVFLVSCFGLFLIWFWFCVRDVLLLWSYLLFIAMKQQSLSGFISLHNDLQH